MKEEQKSDVEVLQKLRSFCAYRERATSEVRQKAKELGASDEEIGFYSKQLEQEGFVDDARFAQLFARSKFRQNQWGKYKIRAALAEKRVKSGLIELALAELDQEKYEREAAALVEKFIDKGYAAGQIFQKMKMKGFEGDLVYSLLQKNGLV